MANAMIYIDESGDLGCRKGTKWFILTALIVTSEEEKDLVREMRKIKSVLNMKIIHWKNIRDFDKRRFIAGAISSKNFTYINVLIDTDKIDMSLMQGSTKGVSNNDILYNYMCRYLLERASNFLAKNGMCADIVLSSRGTTKDKNLIEYIEKLLNHPHNSIDKTTIQKIKSRTAGDLELLQVVDVLTSSLRNGLEPNRYGHITPCYSYAFAKHLYKVNGNVSEYGLKYFTKDMKPKEKMRGVICKDF
ncbi:DUF3800 domain-containing protein [Ruminococcaceae bacterium OttesenSCG-928-A16]|nr:DUF3800 domain-containing protein [Ruminococcaceae bacterium OttesenSCG-928-A16]